MLVLQILTILIALIVGSGAALFFIKYGTRLAFVERDSTEALSIARKTDKDQLVVTQRVSNVEKVIEKIEGSLSKLNLLDSIKVGLDGLGSRLDAITAQSVPRQEIEARFKSLNDELADVHRQTDQLSAGDR
jgi:hypothetical protein